MKQITNKHKFLILLVSCLLLAGIIGVTYAYNKDTTEEKTNTFTVGNVTTEIEEEVKITGTSIEKKPYVKNTGINACYIRVRVTVSPEDAVKITDWQTEKWKLENDGYYYYQDKVEPGKRTEVPVFTGAEITKAGYTGDVEITCYQEAVQAEATVESQKVTDMMTIWEAYDSGKDVFKK